MEMLDYDNLTPRFEDINSELDYMDYNFFSLDQEITDIFDQTCKEVGCESRNNLTRDMLLKPKIKKEKIVDWLMYSFSILKKSRAVLFQADKAISNVFKECNADKKQIIKLQNDIIQMKTDQLEQVSSTVKCEMKSYCDIVKKSCKKAAVSPEKLKDIVKSVAEEDDKSKNLIVFGVKEEKAEDIGAIVSDLLECTGEKPHVIECTRLGRSADNTTARPIKVKLNSSDAVVQVLRNSGKLRRNDPFRSVYISPDRTKEEQASHRKLVEEMKEKIKTDPSNYHFIRNKTIVSVIRTQAKDKTG